MAIDKITTPAVTDDSVTLAKMAPGTDGNIISYDASGNPVAVATGSDGQVLTSTGAGSPPAFETPASAANTPFCYGQKASATVVSRGTSTKVTGMTNLEIDTANAFDGTRFTVPSGQGGKYQIIATMSADYADVGQDGEETAVAIRINNSEKALATIRSSSSVTGTGRVITTVANMIASLSATDYVEMFAHIQDSSGGDAKIAADLTYLTVFKLIE